MADNSKNSTSLLRKRQTSYEGFLKQLDEIRAKRTPEFLQRQQERRAQMPVTTSPTPKK